MEKAEPRPKTDPLPLILLGALFLLAVFAALNGGGGGAEKAGAAITTTITTTATTATRPATDHLILERQEGWGPCPPDAVCHEEARLYSSGLFSVSGGRNYTETLSKPELDAVIDGIRSTGIMDLPCGYSPVVDYLAIYGLNIGGQTKIVIYPGCEEELGKIDALLPQPPETGQGGA